MIERLYAALVLLTIVALATVGIITVAVAVDARAAEAPTPAPSPTITLTDADITNWAQITVAMDACVAGLQLRSDPNVCRGLASYLTQFAGRVQIAKQQAIAPQPAPAEPTKP
jgi:hypothetical protein